jgi:hypothetical protein
MSLDITRLGSSIKNAVLALPAGVDQDNNPVTVADFISTTKYFGIDTDTMLQNYCNAIAGAVITEIQDNAEAIVSMSIHTHTGGTLVGGMTGPPQIPPVNETGTIT